jgi:hypothetical protein
MVLSILIGARETLVRKLEISFPTHGVMDAFGIMYPQYNRNVMQHLSNTFKLLNQLFAWAKPIRWTTKI